MTATLIILALCCLAGAIKHQQARVAKANREITRRRASWSERPTVIHDLTASDYAKWENP